MASTIPGPKGPFTVGPLTNPAVNTILADTGPLLIGAQRPKFTISSTIALVAVFEWRDAANAVNVFSHPFPIAANVPFNFEFPGDLIMSEDGERFRLRLNAAITGLCQATMFSS